jgi:heterotetrameric sarcosine oxidase gamma subunit
MTASRSANTDGRAAPAAAPPDGPTGTRPATFTPVRLTAMYRAQVAAGARFRDAAGWRVADVYTSADLELEGARHAVGLHDASASGKLGVRGADVEAVVAKLCSRPAPPIATAARARVNGGPVLVGRLAADELLLLTRAADAGDVESAVAAATADVGCAHAMDLTAALAGLELVGPRVEVLLERLLPLDLSLVQPLGVAQAELAGVHAIVLRLDQPDLAAFRILVPREYGAFVWAALVGAGVDLGLVLVGATARERLALDGEAGPIEA